jgi:hypothetical protein
MAGNRNLQTPDNQQFLMFIAIHSYSACSSISSSCN